MEGVYNYNIGVLGHIDSGKTSLVRVLSTVLSTASLDKSPQSQERKITLDLGFSSFRVPMPDRFSEVASTLQFTLVDCPGHASLIRTVIAGSAIIDKMLLVIDATKGVQTQTAECIVIGELLIKGSLLVALNKIDQVDASKLDSMESKLRALFSKTKFGSNVHISRVAAAPRDGPPIGVDELIGTILESIEYLPDRRVDSPLCYLVDHCFPIKGQGTVLTGTIISGSLRPGDTVEIVNLGVTKKVKSMQSFHQKIQEAHTGDRVAVCVTQFDSKQLERGIVATPRSVRMSSKFIIRVEKIAHFKYAVTSKAKFHFVMANEVIMGQCLFFSAPSEESKSEFEQPTEHFTPDLFYAYEPSLEIKKDKNYFALVTLDSDLCIINDALLLGAKLDIDQNKMCRIAFYGSIEHAEPQQNSDFLKIFKEKEKKGRVERVKDENYAIGTDMFSKNSDISKFIGLKVQVDGAEAVIESTFAKNGKFNLRFPERDAKVGEIVLKFKKLLWDPRNQLIQ